VHELILPGAHPRQKAILNSSARFRVVACGRRFGKTTIGERSILIRASDAGQACWWLSPTYAMAGHVWRDLKTAVRHVPDVQISESDLRMDFPGGGWLEMHSAHNPDHLRGAGLDFAVLDEAAFMPPDIWSEIVRPMLLERKGHALFLSTPFGKNWFYDLYLLGQHPNDFVGTRYIASADDINMITIAQEGGSQRSEDRFPPAQSNRVALAPGLEDDWHSWSFPSSANPLIDPAELESIRLQTPEHIWLQEYAAEFTDSAGQVFRGIRESAVAPLNAEPVPGARYVVGLDWGRDNDYTAIVVIDTEKSAVVALDRFNQVSWSLQRGRLKAVCDRWKPVVIYAESNSIGSPNIEALQAEGLPVRPFLTTSTSKPPLIDALSLAIERRELALLPDEILLAELASYTFDRLPAGSYRYSAPPGLHDDLVIALALAWYAARHSALPISFA
jgi:hypothetical protein